MKTAVLFSGQGSQYVGMGKDLCEHPIAQAVFNEANGALGFSITEIMFEGPVETLMQTRYTQPAILTMSIAIFEILRAKGIQPDIAAGLSLGEYGALYAAGAIDLKTAVRLVYERGKLMEQGNEHIETAMYALISSDREKVQVICQETAGIVEISNYNCKGQIVIAGEKAAVEAAVVKLKAAKIRAIPLKVSGAFHTSLLKAAGVQFQAILEQTQFEKLQIPVLANVTGDYYKDEEIKGILAKQVYSAVYFEDELEKLAVAGVTRFIEIGPKNTLTTFVKKTLKDVEAVNTDTLENIEKI